MVDKKALYQAILEGDANQSKSLAEEAVKEGVDPKSLLDESMIPAMDEVGRLFESDEYFVPELLIAARAMRSALEVIKPLLAETGAKPVGSVAIGTVKGDLHDIGKNLVAAMLEGGGFEIVDLGVDADPALFVSAVKEKGVNVVALSALLTTTMPGMKKVIEELESAGVRGQT
ncbi:MAG: B12-binding domain-containing protein, partial [Candidatus Omnitrophica bacterium]|nr:B12-binding domain-containing protein [Candidatus Omnitrophota bacterium]